ncbi:Gfo/Idh/MocA family protein [Fodinibius sediminis]|uniref:Predicted dehydrogenase n=1 Tax=Fodinibius sediminis TaxID=1214077 RepID=A0A521C1J8_9BACT|nr:Gfo/Idh/MocA family oxidoreductase [Fodinibius sediminis]SMO52691.1 Predicted dehydrogenase [Fodinibius sediminis]
MSNSFGRKEFLKFLGLAGFTGTGIFSNIANGLQGHPPYKKTHSQRFNMHGYAAPKLETVRIGIIGVGNRGSGAVRRLSRIEGVDIKAICDLEEERVNAAIQSIEETSHNPEAYFGGEEEWKKVCNREDIDLIYICTPWDWHTPMAVYAMKHEKHAATEIPAAQTLDQCWELVETSENTRQHCMMLENACYDFFEMMTLNMVRDGFFGEIIHGEGAYIHQLINHNFSKDNYSNMWRLKENLNRDGNLYPMHGLGPIAQAMNINCGDQMEYMVSMSSDDFMMRKKANELAEEDEFWEQYADWDYRGNINTSTIRTRKGRTIMLQHDVTSPRPYSRIHVLSGTEGIARKWPLPARIAKGHEGWISDEEFAELEEEYTPEITKRVGRMAQQVGGHGGMDTLMDWRLIDCLRNGYPLDMTVYDAALWSSIIPLSERSVANKSETLDVPDFTGGAWKTNEPRMDIELEQSGSTQIL